MLNQPRERTTKMSRFITTVLLFSLVCCTKSWSEDSVLLRDVQALTLYKGRHTTARRSSPIPQLQCVGGSAGCKAFVPEVVQCVNKGWDGVDVQWECKTDLDNGYRFGRIEVSCEGYNHQADAHILKGSCGLEYTLELTDEGRRSSQGHGGLGGFASSFFSGSSGNKYQQNQQSHERSSDSAHSDWLVIVVLLLLAYGVYKLFLSGGTTQQGGDYARDNHDGSAGRPPPPPGFKAEYTGHPDPKPGYGFHSDYTSGPQHPGGRATPNTGGGFWTGLGTGGVLGYLFGRQRRQPYGHFDSSSTTYRPSGRSSWSSPSSSSSGTRTASGFGGTKRR